jgi:hypothetical protein
LVLRISFIFCLIIHLIFRSVNLVTELLLCVNNFGIGDRYNRTTLDKYDDESLGVLLHPLFGYS